MQFRWCLLVVPCLAAAAAPAPGPSNLGFESGQPGQVPSGWFIPSTPQKAGYSAVLQRSGCKSGSGCALLSTPASPSPQGFGNLMQTFDASAYRGKRIRFRAWVRVEAPAGEGQAQLWLRVDRPSRQMGFFDNMGDRPITSPEWRSYEISGQVEPDALYLNLGVMVIGKGRAWIDDASFETVAAPAPAAASGEVRGAIEKLYRRIDQAYESGEFDAIAGLALPDARIGGGGAPMPLGVVLNLLKAEYKKGARYHSRSAVTGIEVRGGDAVVSVRNEASQTSGGSKQAMLNTTRDTWTLTAGGWKLKESVHLSSRALVSATDAETAKSLAAEIHRLAAPLATVQAGNQLDDLAAFGRAVGDARIVSLGEATHGTREFFQMKHRLLEYLVKEKGFTVFAIEANWPESLAVDRYVKTGEGDPRVALAGMYFWTWNTQEVLDMIEWMRAYNRAAGERPKLTFTSFDMQTPDVAADRVLEYLRKAAPAQAAEAEAVYREVRVLSARRGEMFDDGAGALAARAEGVVRLLDGRREAFLQESTPEAWRDARQAAEIVRQAVAMRAASSGPAYRDEMMARNVEWLADRVHAGEKLVLWAHNGHVQFAEQMGLKSMGGWLRQRFGRAMYVVGFAFRGGELRAVGRSQGKPTGLGNHVAPRSPEGSGDAVLSAAGLPLMFLDLRAVPAESALGRWLAEPHAYLNAGAIWMQDTPESHLSPVSLAKAYDGLIYIEESHAAQGLPMGSRF